MTSLMWFREDLRCADNPAWRAAVAAGPVTPVFILDEKTPNLRRAGAASRWWLHHSLRALDDELDGALVLRRGAAAEQIDSLLKETGAARIFWNRVYEAGAIARDTATKAALRARGLDVHTFNGALLHEPWAVRRGAEAPYKVFTPYWRAATRLPVDAPLPAPQPSYAQPHPSSEKLNDWRLAPAKPDWAAHWMTHWRPGERGAQARLSEFLSGAIKNYAALRDRADKETVSRLSPHLRWGEISPRQIWTAVAHAMETGAAPARDGEAFLRQIGWREFSYHLLFHFPDMARRNWKSAFDAYPWRENAHDLDAWRRGRTGYPWIDAGMRELWATGHMHNRVRMATASFLIKHLRIDWRKGEQWFWDTLVDADPANNSVGWQWVAGSGADAAPYFRIFNPVVQGQKFDPDGDYVRRWLPELARLPASCIHAPFAAPGALLEKAGIQLGETYPRPIVDHAQARAAALAGYAAIKAKP
ncbi:MAG: deoxyribodipyrimidine photo-lyase [Hyphomonadaceae bacterium]